MKDGTQMNTIKFPKIAAGSIAVAVLSLLQACGGGGGADDLASNNDNPTGVAVYAGADSSYLGTISGLGSIVVNGVRFETTSASVVDSDDTYGSSEYLNPLALGMTVALQGSSDETQSIGRAQKIRLIGGVRGTVSAFVAGQEMTVNGQTIALTATTLFADAAGQSFSVQAGDYVNVYGLMQADNRFVATRVSKTSAAAFNLDAAWRGQSSSAVSSDAGLTLSLNTGGVNNFTVSCPVASCTVEPAGAALTGLHAVRVLAGDDSQRAGNNILASKIQVLDATRLLNWTGNPVGLTKIKGVAATDGTQWSVGGVPVVWTGAPWVTGQFYEVKGTLSAEGRLTVTQRELEGQESYRAINTGGSASYYRNELYGAVSNLQGNTMTVQGVTVDASQASFEGATLATLTQGAYVEVKGAMTNGVLLASKIQVKNSLVAGQGTRFEVYGTVSNWSASGFKLTTGNTQYNAVLNAQSRIDSEHALPGDGRFVEVKGYMSGTDFVVVKMEVKSGGNRDD